MALRGGNSRDRQRPSGIGGLAGGIKTQVSSNLLLSDGTSKLLLSDGTSKMVLN